MKYRDTNNYQVIYILPNARPKITTLISVESMKNRTMTHNILSVYPPQIAAALIVIDTQQRIRLIITFSKT